VESDFIIAVLKEEGEERMMRKLHLAAITLGLLIVFTMVPMSQASVGLKGKDIMNSAVHGLLTESSQFYGASQSSGIWLTTNLNINIIFVGISKERIDLDTVSSMLPHTYSPIVRDPAFYGIYEPMDITFNLKYNFIFTSEFFNRGLFTYILRIGSRGNPTTWQTQYSQDPKALLNITSNLYVSAKDVEAYLLGNLNKIPGVVKGYTLFLLDGYTNKYMASMGGFVFHTYFFNEPDPDTGAAFGLRGSRQGIAWGGTMGRVWFYDFSAGPEYWSNNWNPAYYWDKKYQAKPPIWHYVKSKAYHLSIDVAEIARFIATNLLFTPSPLYKPLLATKVHINVVMFENASQVGFYGKDWFNITFTEQAYEMFEPYKEWRVTFKDVNLMDYPELNRVFQNWAQGGSSLYIPGASSWMDFYWYYYHIAGIQTFLDPEAAAWADHSIPVFAFAVPDASMGIQWGLLGWADDDWATGTQTFINAFGSPDITLTYGYGYTTTVVHEAGHHIGQSHPHDGYDSEMGLDYGPEGYYQFVWTGDETYSVMSYLSNVQLFGQFDRDTLYRNEGVLYLEAVEQKLGSMPNPKGLLIEKIWFLYQEAISAFYRMDYYGMVVKAHQAYQLAQSF
jgi:hypothetical protein